MDWGEQQQRVLENEVADHLMNCILPFIAERDGRQGEEDGLRVQIYYTTAKEFLLWVRYTNTVDGPPDIYFVMKDKSQREAIEIPRPEIINESRRLVTWTVFGLARPKDTKTKSEE